MWAYLVQGLSRRLSRLGVKGNVGSDIPLVATFSFWRTTGIWLILVGVQMGEVTWRSEKFFFG